MSEYYLLKYGNRRKLIEAITKLSETNKHIDKTLTKDKQYNIMCDLWAETCSEWCISEMADIPNCACVCGHRISENCAITNILNNNSAIVGNVCIDQFSHPDLIFKFKQRKKAKDKLNQLFHKKLAIKLKVKYMGFREEENDFLYQFINNDMIKNIKEVCDEKQYKYRFWNTNEQYYFSLKKKTKKTLFKIEKIHTNLKVSS